MITSSKDLLSVATAEEVVKAMMNHPALYAYHLKDEPEVNDLPGLGELVKKIKTIDSHHPCYINLYPNWAWGKELYSENVKSFIEQVPVPFISFDNYPIVSIMVLQALFVRTGIGIWKKYRLLLKRTKSRFGHLHLHFLISLMKLIFIRYRHCPS